MHLRNESQNAGGSNHVRRRLWLRLLYTLCPVLAVLFVASLFVPVLDVHKRQRADEAAAVGRLRRVNALQDAYAASYPSKGFACRLPLLKPATPVSDTYNPDEFLLTGTHSGYRFAVTGCRADPSGVVRQYDLVAVPLETRKSGFRTFCTDQTGATWYDSDGSAEHCLASRRTLQ
jgi:hypothetical protein